MELNKYNNMSIDELKKLYLDVSTISKDLLEENLEYLIELTELKKQINKLTSIRNQIIEIKENNSIDKSKKLSYIFTLTGIVSLGVVLELISLDNSYLNNIPTIVAGTTTAVSTIGTYTSITSYKHNKNLIDNNNILYLNPKISKIQKRINTLEYNINLNNKIINKANDSLDYLYERIFNLRKEQQLKKLNTNNKQIYRQKTKKKSLKQQTLVTK